MNPIIESVKANLDLNQNLPLKQLFYQALRKTIILREIPAGSRINEKEFSLELNISRTPIRYALAQLLEEKLVEHIPKKGIIVKGVSIEDAMEIFEIRKSLDTLASITAMKKMSPDDFNDMKAILTECETFIVDGDVEQILDNFNQFNNCIYEKSRMVRLREIVSELQTYLTYFREISISSLERRQLALSEHWDIYHYMKEQNAEKVTEITHQHLNRSLTFILKEMDAQPHD